MHLLNQSFKPRGCAPGSVAKNNTNIPGTQGVIKVPKDGDTQQLPHHKNLFKYQ